MMNELDRNIINLAVNGDKMAFRNIVLHYGKTINRLAFRYTANSSCAEDIAQETFIKAFNSISRYQHEAKFSTWLFRIATNASIDYLRKAKKHKNLTSETDQIEQHGIDSKISNDIQLDYSRQIHTAMADLSEVERLAFTLKHYQGYSIDETAQVLKIKNNACKQTIYRAVQKLRKQLTSVVST